MIKIQKITEVQPHTNADRLEVVIIGGWTVIVQKETFKKDDLVVFIPPDSILPEGLHEHLGITKYCHQMPKNEDGTRPTSRIVKATKIRGTPSFGTVMKLDDLCHFDMEEVKSQRLDTYIEYGDKESFLESYQEGQDHTKLLGITKWNSPIKTVAGDQEEDRLLFHKYTNIKNWRDYGNKLINGEEVVISSKIHGSNSRLGIVDGELMAGSHNTRKKHGVCIHKEKKIYNTSLYWEPFEWYPQIKDWLKNTIDTFQSVIIFGEIFGSGVQKMAYGMENGKKDFRAFDISIDGRYLDWEDFEQICHDEKIPYIPILYKGPYSREIVEKYTSGPAVVCNADNIKGKFKGREGCVIKPVEERIDEHIGRIVLKSVSVDYLGQ